MYTARSVCVLAEPNMEPFCLYNPGGFPEESTRHCFYITSICCFRHSTSLLRHQDRWLGACNKWIFNQTIIWKPKAALVHQPLFHTQQPIRNPRSPNLYGQVHELRRQSRNFKQRVKERNPILQVPRSLFQGKLRILETPASLHQQSRIDDLKTRIQLKEKIGKLLTRVLHAITNGVCMVCDVLNWISWLMKRLFFLPVHVVLPL